MIKLGNVDSGEVKENFLEKFHKQRDDASEYEFGVIKGEKLSTTVFHEPCGKVFNSRPYLFIQEGWVKKCPYCYPYKKNKLTKEDVRERIDRNTNGHIHMMEHEEKYIGRQKIHQVYLKCNDCGYEFSRNIQSIDEGFTCPSCNNLQ